jgi:arginine decarboxylase
VQYDRRSLTERVRRTIEHSLRLGRISIEESAQLRRRFEQGLDDYTYLSAEK